MHQPTLDLAQRLASIEVLDVEGRPHPIGTLLAGRASVLVFIRHFG